MAGYFIESYNHRIVLVAILFHQGGRAFFDLSKLPRSNQIRRLDQQL